MENNNVLTVVCFPIPYSIWKERANPFERRSAFDVVLTQDSEDTVGFFLVMEEYTFRAAHKIRFPDGMWEPLHEHDWLLRIFVQTQQLDEQQLVVDFLDLQAHLQAVLAPYQGQNINTLPPFCDGISPTTEYLAWSFFQALAQRINTDRVSLCRVELREAPTSWGIYTATGGAW